MATGAAESIPTKEPKAASVAAPAQPFTNPYIGILGVFLGAAAASMNSRLISIGLPDLRGAKGFGFDEASWIPAALDMALMFSGVFCVFLNGRLGPRRILLPCAAVFTATSFLIPFSPNLWVMLFLQVLAGLSSGTFYSLTLTFALVALPKRLVIWGIAAYAGDIVFSTNISEALQAWYVEHLSWHWIFWNATVLTPLMFICVYFGIPKHSLPPGPAPSWRGWTYFSFGLALIVGAFDQGERLDWLNSGVIVAMLTAGIFLVIAAFIRRKRQPNPITDLAFLKTRNAIILGISITVFRFLLLVAYILIPAYLANIKDYRPLQIGQTLAWVAVPVLALVWVVPLIIIGTGSRLIMAVGFTSIAVTSLIFSRVDSSWAGTSFQRVELFLAAGLACSYVGMVGSIVLEALEAGALKSAKNVCSFSGLMHLNRIFGGSAGVAVLTHFLSVREKFHSNMLGLHVQAGNWLTTERLRMFTGGLFPESTGLDQAQARGMVLLGKQVRAQAYTMAIGDGFVLIAWVVIGFFAAMLLLKPGKISYKDLRNMK
ncbi:MAG: MFS transporter [Acidobacteriaceae bacterium]|nr:MFS transporter [Acidobacteriaceae bacterium]